MVFTLFEVALVIVGLLVVYVVFSNSKLSFRLRGFSNRAQDKVADKLGTIADDREQKIQDRQKLNAGLRVQLAAIKKEILLNTERHKNAFAEAEKYAELAKEAVAKNNDAAAREALQFKQSKEKLAQTLLENIESCEATYRELKSQYDESVESVTQAKSNQELFKAEYHSLDLRRKMQESKTAFGGLGNLDFASSDAELEALKAEVQAYSSIDESGSALSEFQKEVKISAVDAELANLKRAQNV